MGFIKSIFGIVGGLFKTILGVFGIGKKSEFYMELEEGAAEAASEATAPTAPATPAVTAAPAQAVSKPEPSPAPVAAKPAVAPVAPQPEKTASPVPSFAANYLIGNTTSRRRPGPSLSPFKAMAKQVSPR